MTSDRLRIIASVISQHNEKPVRESLALIVTRRRRFESKKTSGRNTMTLVCSVQKTHLVQQESRVDGSHMADVATSPTGYAALFSSRYYLYKVCLRVRRSSSDSYLFCMKKTFVSAEWQKSISTTRRYPESHAFSAHRHKINSDLSV